MGSSGSWRLLALINLLLPIGILIFAKGFFPYKPVFPGLATFEDTPPSAPFDKLVFMVVDALRRYYPALFFFSGVPLISEIQ